MDPTILVLLLWIGFAGSHLVLSSMPVRGALIERLGAQAFSGLYSLLALGFFVPLVWVYLDNKHAGPWLWSISLGQGLRWLIYIGMGVAFVLVVASLMRPSPAGFVPGEAKVRGIYRITRHPLLMGFVLFAVLHLIPNGSAADVAFFGGFIVFSVVGALHQDARKLAADVPGFREFHAAAPFLPFTGRETLRGFRELSPVAIALGVGLTVLVRWYHTSWF